MRIITITYINHKTGWNIKNLQLDYLTLLVGVSGIGKTQILKALMNLAKIASGFSANSIEWNVDFTHNSSQYQWTGRFEDAPADGIDTLDSERRKSSLIFEKLVCEGEVIIERTLGEIKFNGLKTVKLDTHKSAIELLKEEDLIAPVYDAFGHVYMLDNSNNGIRISPFINEDFTMITDIETIHKSRRLSPLEKLFLLCKNGFPEFTTIKENFINVFPIVEDIDFKTAKLFDDHTIPVLRIKERGVDTWISQFSISSGMFRTLMQITIFELAQDGDLFLIDEFENGLGVNCIDKLADEVLDSDKEIQTLITSHHPYIINNIPFERWKVVVREKSDVSVLTASDLKIGIHSRHDAFMQLIQTKAFKTGQR